MPLEARIVLAPLAARTLLEEVLMKPKEVLSLMQENEVKFVDFRFTDTKGKEQHVTTKPR